MAKHHQIYKFTKTRNWREFSERTRWKIKVGRIIDLLQRYVLEGTVELNGAQIKSAQILLNKALPNLTMADVTQHTEPNIDPDEVYRRLAETVGKDVADVMMGRAKGRLITVEAPPESNQDRDNPTEEG